MGFNPTPTRDRDHSPAPANRIPYPHPQARKQAAVVQAEAATLGTQLQQEREAVASAQVLAMQPLLLLPPRGRFICSALMATLPSLSTLSCSKTCVTDLTPPAHIPTNTLTPMPPCVPKPA